MLEELYYLFLFVPLITIEDNTLRIEREITKEGSAVHLVLTHGGQERQLQIE